MSCNLSSRVKEYGVQRQAAQPGSDGQPCRKDHSGMLSREERPKAPPLLCRLCCSRCSRSQAAAYTGRHQVSPIHSPRAAITAAVPAAASRCMNTAAPAAAPAAGAARAAPAGGQGADGACCDECRTGDLRSRLQMRALYSCSCLARRSCQLSGCGANGPRGLAVQRRAVWRSGRHCRWQRGWGHCRRRQDAASAAAACSPPISAAVSACSAGAAPEAQQLCQRGEDAVG